MSDTGHLAEVGRVTAALAAEGLQPTLIGGMALVVLGSTRVTRDFDFLVAHPGERLGELVGRFYDLGFELASRIDAQGAVTATIDNRRVAGIRLRTDAPVNASFLNRSTGLRVDLLFDFPVAAADVAARASRRVIHSVVLHVAAEEDLLRLKRLAHGARDAASDAQDIAFLEARLR